MPCGESILVCQCHVTITLLVIPVTEIEVIDIINLNIKILQNMMEFQIIF